MLEKWRWRMTRFLFSGCCTGRKINLMLVTIFPVMENGENTDNFRLYPTHPTSKFFPCFNSWKEICMKFHGKLNFRASPLEHPEFSPFNTQHTSCLQHDSWIHDISHDITQTFWIFNFPTVFPSPHNISCCTTFTSTKPFKVLPVHNSSPTKSPRT